MSAHFEARQLTVARERRGMTKAQLADACGVDRKTVTEWEKGRVLVPPTDMLARQLRFPEEFFYKEPRPALAPELANFRALSSMSARRTHQTLATAIIIARLAGWLDDHFQTPELDLPGIDRVAVLTQSDAALGHTGAVHTREHWGLADHVIPDMTALLESKGVRIFGLPDEIREVDAFSVWIDNRPTIFLNIDKSAERLRFDLAHELGHLVMHRGIVTVKSKGYETEANDFAGRFLVPPSALYAMVRRSPTLADVFILKEQFRISAVAMVYQIHRCGLINDWQYRTWMVELNRRGFRRGEPGGIQHERSQLLAGVLRLAREDGYTIRSIAAELGVPADDISAAFAGLAPMPVG